MTIDYLFIRHRVAERAKCLYRISATQLSFLRTILDLRCSQLWGHDESEFVAFGIATNRRRSAYRLSAEAANRGGDSEQLGLVMMLRKCSLVAAIAASLLLPAIAFAAQADGKRAQPVKAKRHVARHWHGYGFLPGYPPAAAEGRRQEYFYHGPYWYRGRYLYGYGGPGYYRGRWNGGSFGPCWTSTPIGMMWNCGK